MPKDGKKKLNSGGTGHELETQSAMCRMDDFRSGRAVRRAGVIGRWSPAVTARARPAFGVRGPPTDAGTPKNSRGGLIKSTGKVPNGVRYLFPLSTLTSRGDACHGQETNRKTQQEQSTS